MAAPPKYPTPAEQLCEIAIEGRRQGLDFEEVWAMAVLVRPAVTTRTPPERRPPMAVVYPGDTFDRKVWRAALEATRDGWRRAYYGEPCPGEEALGFLADALPVETEAPHYREQVAA